MNPESNNINNSSFDKKKLLNELASDIANKFQIDKTKAEKLIKSETLISLETFKIELNNNQKNSNEKLSTKNIEKLFFTLKGALELIENSSKLEIKTLKETIEKNDIGEINNLVKLNLPKKLINAAQNPEKVHEHILGFTLGTTSSLIATVDILYQIGAGIIKTPYHLYMIVSGKGKSNSFKNI